MLRHGVPGNAIHSRKHGSIDLPNHGCLIELLCCSHRCNRKLREEQNANTQPNRNQSRQLNPSNIVSPIFNA
jgi:hypothetical protein